MKSGRGFAVDTSLGALGFDADTEGFEVYTKALEAPKPKPAAAAAPAPVAAPAPLVDPTLATTTPSTASTSSGVFNFAATAAALHQSDNGNDCATDGEDSAPAVPVEKEAEVIAQLTELFVEKQGRQPTEVEVGMWLQQIRSLEEGDLKERPNYSSSSSSNQVEEDDWVHVEGGDNESA